MDMLTTGVLCFAAGVVVGAGLLFWLLPARRQAGQLIRDRDEARQALNHYRDQVDDHFLHTAELVNDMTQAYRSVHEHLSKGAQVLCSEVGRKRAVAKSLDSAPQKGSDEPVAPPLDYAPSAKGGTLAEDFGLQQKATGPFTPVDVADSPAPDNIVEPPRDYAEGCDEQGCPPEEKK
ncbi:MAG: YhcB family protein [Alcanivorax sp.]|uniref:YhcB family protein n=1 Tax=Alcanivorax sp. TaxID=1872427 RepID=UPI003DA79975